MGEWSAKGLPWRQWSAAEMTAVLRADLIGRLIAQGDRKLLREFFVLCEDSESVAALDRAVMGQPRSVELDEVR